MRIADGCPQPALFTHAVADHGCELAAAACGIAAPAAGRPVARAGGKVALTHLIGCEARKHFHLLLRKRTDQFRRRRQTRRAFQQGVIPPQKQAVRGGCRQDVRMPDDAAGVIPTQGGKYPTRVLSDIGKTPEDPGRDAQHVAGAALDFAGARALAPAEFPAP
ncbi:hypothetical protein G6F22_018491 [Rhizopus arrhizus]|nr:hypothetical protein G6F22_018491 [Rhizopus arrhizus]